MTDQCPETKAEHAWRLKYERYKGAYRVYRCARCGQEKVRPEVLSRLGRSNREAA